MERPRSPGIAFGALSVVLLVLLGLIAMTSRTPPPPTIAEFAPQSLENITESPQDQSGRQRGGTGASGDGDLLTAGQPTPQILELPRVRRCVGDPPRQTEDPQSPPCVPFWSGDNGGATSKGVTADEIRVSVITKEEVALVEDYVAFFNKRFEFYGRRIKLIPEVPNRQGCCVTVEAMQADAARIDEQRRVFAHMGYADDQHDRSYVFYDELARRHVVSSSASYTELSMADQARYTRFAPYQWNYFQSPDDILRNLGEFYCKALAGRPPRWAGPPQSAAAERKLGLIYETHPDGTPPVDYEPLRRALRACNEDVYAVGDTSFDEGNRSGTTAIVKLQQEGVTTLVCLCHTSSVALSYMPAASGQRYFPEWISTNFGHQDDDFAASVYPKDQSAHLMGIQSYNKSVPHAESFCTISVREANPAQTKAACALYYNLLVLSSGFQMAGPRLTPQAFQDGLFKTRFPNPGADGPPRYQARVGFGPDDHTMQDTFVPVWFNSAAESYARPANTTGLYGAWCYPDRGLRYGPGTWPAREPAFFSSDCY